MECSKEQGKRRQRRRSDSSDSEYGTCYFFLKLFNLQNKHSEDNDPIMLTLGKTNKPLFHIDHILGTAHRLD